MDKGLKLLKDKYGLNFGSYKYILPGAEIMRYIGQNLMKVEYTKKEDGTWEHIYTPVMVKSISKFDPMNMTYECIYLEEGKTEEEVLRIVPEGYSWGNPEESGKMIRLVPFSVHTQMVEDDNFFQRVQKLYSERETLTLDALQTIARSKEKEAILKYTHNIGACVKLDDGEFLWVRFHGVNISHKRGNTWSLKFSDNDRYWCVLIDSDERDYDFNGYGRFKIIDLSDPGEQSTEEMIKTMEDLIKRGVQEKVKSKNLEEKIADAIPDSGPIAEE